MIDDFKKRLKNYNFSFEIKNNNVVHLKNTYGILIVNVNKDSYSIKKKYNLNSYLYFIAIIFFSLIVFVNRNRCSSLFYIIFIILWINLFLYNNVMLELQKNKIHFILDKLYE